MMLQHISMTSGSTTNQSRTSARPTFWSSATPTTSRSSSPPRSSQVWRGGRSLLLFGEQLRQIRFNPGEVRRQVRPVRPGVQTGGQVQHLVAALGDGLDDDVPSGSPPRKSGGRVLLGLDGIRRRRCEYVAPQAASERPDRHQTPGSQEADVGDRGGDTERRQTRVDGQLRRAGDEGAHREGQAPPGQRERHAAPGGTDRQRRRQSDPQHGESPDRNAVQNREHAHAVCQVRVDCQRGVRTEKSCGRDGLAERTQDDPQRRHASGARGAEVREATPHHRDDDERGDERQPEHRIAAVEHGLPAGARRHVRDQQRARRRRHHRRHHRHQPAPECGVGLDAVLGEHQIGDAYRGEQSTERACPRAAWTSRFWESEPTGTSRSTSQGRRWPH